MHVEKTTRRETEANQQANTHTKIPNRLSFFIFNLFLLKKSIRIDISKIRSPAHSQDDCDIRRAHNINTFHIERSHTHTHDALVFVQLCTSMCIYFDCDNLNVKSKFVSFDLFFGDGWFDNDMFDAVNAYAPLSTSTYLSNAIATRRTYSRCHRLRSFWQMHDLSNQLFRYTPLEFEWRSPAYSIIFMRSMFAILFHIRPKDRNRWKWLCKTARKIELVYSLTSTETRCSSKERRKKLYGIWNTIC